MKTKLLNPRNGSEKTVTTFKTLKNHDKYKQKYICKFWDVQLHGAHVNGLVEYFHRFQPQEVNNPTELGGPSQA